MPDTFHYCLTAQIRQTPNLPWTEFKAERLTTCRELAIRGIRDSFYGLGIYNILRLEVQNVAMKVSISYPWIDNSSPVFKEIADATDTQIEITTMLDKFTGHPRPFFQISDNDPMVMPSFYWLVLAMRKGIQEREGTFKERMLDTIPQDTGVWNWGYDRLSSVRAWDRLTQKGMTPSTLEMISSGFGPIEWYGWAKKHRNAHWLDGLVHPIYAPQAPVEA